MKWRIKVVSFCTVRCSLPTRCCVRISLVSPVLPGKQTFGVRRLRQACSHQTLFQIFFCYFDIICFPLQLLFKGSAQVPGSLAAEEASDHRGASWDQLPCLLCNWMQASQAPELWPGSTDRSSNNGLVPIFLSFFS